MFYAWASSPLGQLFHVPFFSILLQILWGSVRFLCLFLLTCHDFENERMVAVQTPVGFGGTPGQRRNCHPAVCVSVCHRSVRAVDIDLTTTVQLKLANSTIHWTKTRFGWHVIGFCEHSAKTRVGFQSPPTPILCVLPLWKRKISWCKHKFFFKTLVQQSTGICSSIQWRGSAACIRGRCQINNSSRRGLVISWFLCLKNSETMHGKQHCPVICAK